jgi:hypothetical protein
MRIWVWSQNLFSTQSKNLFRVKTKRRTTNSFSKGGKKMDSNRKTAIIVGILFLIATITLIIGGIFSLSLNQQDYLTAVSANENQVILGALLEIVAAVAVVGIPIAMFPILRKDDESLALGYVGARIFEGLTIFLNTIILLSILALSQKFVNTVNPDVTYFQTSGTLLLALRERISILVDFPSYWGSDIQLSAVQNKTYSKVDSRPRSYWRHFVVCNSSFAYARF